jgi:histidinol-phosphate aminotransferase
MSIRVPDYISAIEPYKPGKPIEEVEREYGIAGSAKLASNENPLGPSPKALAAIRDHLSRLHRYPDGSGFALVTKLAEKLGVPADSIVLGNGSDEIIGMLARTLLCPGDAVILPYPTFLMYAIMVRSAGATPVFVPLNSDLAVDLEAMRRRLTDATRMVFLCNPNNPTGTIFTRPQFEHFLDGLPRNVVVVLDEAYIDFVREPGCARGLDYLEYDRPVVTLRTFSKAYGLAGLRIGYGVMPVSLAGFLHRIRQPFNTGSLAQIGARAALEDDEFLNRTLQAVHSGLDYLFEALNVRKIRFYPTQANFFLIDVERDADEVFEKMLQQGVIVRSMSAYGYPRFIRVNVGQPEENQRFIKALDKILKA